MSKSLHANAIKINVLAIKSPFLILVCKTQWLFGRLFHFDIGSLNCLPPITLRFRYRIDTILSDPASLLTLECINQLFFITRLVPYYYLTYCLARPWYYVFLFPLLYLLSLYRCLSSLCFRYIPIGIDKCRFSWPVNSFLLNPIHYS